MKSFVFEKVRPSGERVTITREEALEDVLSVYKDDDMTRDMLLIPNHILTPMYSIDVVMIDPDGRRVTSQPGAVNLLPPFQYDDDGNRI